NFLSNAHKFSPLDSPIEVQLREQGQMAHVSVHDEGPGVPSREQKRIWDRFYRSPTVKILNGSEVGLGLGLYLCRAIISQHQGRTGVQSIPGAGSTFWFTLPLLQEKLHSG
ncbi:MAG TPA: sensor histidine kinase, partial [Ktedonobacteraceae bacterium]|nr:sensor histidine kinase [Ktedonobacteraceae bacterium]